MRKNRERISVYLSQVREVVENHKASEFEKHVEQCPQCRNGFLCETANELIEETL